jgi:hypothetical protein
MESEYIYIVFKSVHDAMKTETALQSGGFSFATVPAPREIQPDCGIALRLGVGSHDGVKAFMEGHNLPFAEIVQLTREGSNK